VFDFIGSRHWVMKIKTVIFDLDGTITMPFLDFDAIRRQIGLSEDAGPILEAMEKMPPQQRACAERILNEHERRAVDESVLNFKARETLQTLRENHINIGILTRNKRSNALAIADKHGLIFDSIVDREAGPVKPDAFGVLRLCEHFGTAAEATLVVGDFLYDLLSARAAGAVAVLLKNHHHGKDFSEHADFTIESLDEVLGIIKAKKQQ